MSNAEPKPCMSSAWGWGEGLQSPVSADCLRVDSEVSPAGRGRVARTTASVQLVMDTAIGSLAFILKGPAGAVALTVSSWALGICALEDPSSLSGGGAHTLHICFAFGKSLLWAL